MESISAATVIQCLNSFNFESILTLPYFRFQIGNSDYEACYTV